MHKYCYRDRSWLPAYMRGNFKLKELTLSCNADHLPAEKAVMNPIDEAHPGCDEYLENLYVYAIENGDEIDVTGHITEEQCEEIIEEMLEDLQ